MAVFYQIFMIEPLDIQGLILFKIIHLKNVCIKKLPLTIFGASTRLVRWVMLPWRWCILFHTLTPIFNGTEMCCTSFWENDMYLSVIGRVLFDKLVVPILLPDSVSWCIQNWMLLSPVRKSFQSYKNIE